MIALGPRCPACGKRTWVSKVVAPLYLSGVSVEDKLDWLKAPFPCCACKTRLQVYGGPAPVMALKGFAVVIFVCLLVLVYGDPRIGFNSGAPKALYVFALPILYVLPGFLLTFFLSLEAVPDEGEQKQEKPVPSDENSTSEAGKV